MPTVVILPDYRMAAATIPARRLSVGETVMHRDGGRDRALSGIYLKSNLVQMLTGNLFFLVTCGLTMPFLWQTPPLRESVLLLLLGFCGAAGQFLLFEAIRRAPASVVAPFEYTAMVWAFLLGFLIWGDIPGLGVFGGGGLIILSGLVVFLAERRRALRPVAAETSGAPAA